MTLAARTAVLALHYQNEVLHADGKIRVGVAAADPRRDHVIERAAAMLSGARERGWPIIHVRIAFRPDYADCPRNTPIFLKTIELGAVRDGTWGAQFMDELAPIPSNLEFSFTHTRISAFAGTACEQTLRMLGVERLLVGGVATHSVVEGSVRDAADRGYQVIVAADACAAASAEVQDASLSSMSLVASVLTVDRAFAQLDAA